MTATGYSFISIRILVVNDYEQFSLIIVVMSIAQIIHKKFVNVEYFNRYISINGHRNVPI